MVDLRTKDVKNLNLQANEFDAEWYAERYPDVEKSGMGPLEHFLAYGRRMGRSGAPQGQGSAASSVRADRPAGSSRRAPAFLKVGEHKASVEGPAIELQTGSVAEIAFCGTLAIHLHLYHLEMLPEMQSWLSSIPVPFDLYVSVTTRQAQEQVEDEFEHIACLNRAVVEVYENRGRDIGPMLAGFGSRLAKYDFVGHFHTKRSDHTPDKKDWGIQLGHSLFHSPGYTTRVLNLFAEEQDLGIVFPVYHPSVKGQIEWGANFDTAASQLSRLIGGTQLQPSDLLPFPAGSFFLARTDAIKPLLEAGYQFADFDAEVGQIDGTLAHAIERLFVQVADRRGYAFRQVSASKPHSLGRSYLDNGCPYQSELLEAFRHGEHVSFPVYSRAVLKGLRIRFYTCSTGGYDEPLPFEAFVEGADYHFFSDQGGRQQQAQWSIRPLALEHPHPIKTARRHKTQPHKIFEDVDIAIWIDGNIAVTGDVTELIARVVEDEAAFGVVPHPYRQTVAEELAVLDKLAMDDRKVMHDQVERFRQQGFPDDGGLTETNFLVMDLRRPETRAALDHWWAAIERGSRRDQLSFDFACWKAGAKKVPLISTGVSVRADPRFAYFSHGGKAHPALDLRDRLSDLWLGRELSVDEEQHRRNVLRVDVVVCVHNSPDDVARCLRSIALHRDARTRIIVVDDGSDAPTRRIVSRHLRANPADLVIRHEQAKGYTKAANAGLRASDADYVILLNSDTIVPVGWVDALVAAGEANPAVGIVGPLSNAASWQSVPTTLSSGDLAVNATPAGMSIDDIATMCARLPAEPVYPCPVVNGFCFAVKRKVIDVIGYLDEEAFPQGYGEENDYCLRLADHGMTCGFTLSTYVFHAKSKSFNHERRKILSQQGWNTLVGKYGEGKLSGVVEEMKQHPALEMARRWFRSQTARMQPDAQALALYLPQFHSFAFNDNAWGPGFSEWRNVVKATPRFDGHVQPLLPGELGFYDLRTPETLAKQAALAARFGIDGMAIYYYRFGRERLMAEPTDRLLETPDVPLRFCYCWANEDWTRAWDGKTSEILLKQDYSDETLRLLVDDLCHACADTRYIRIDDRPVLMIYQLDRLPDAEATLSRIRELVGERLAIEPVIGTTWNERFREEWEPLVDFIVQFPPHRTPRVSKRTLLDRTQVSGASAQTADHLESYDLVMSQSTEAMDELDRLAPGVCPAWDNSPRRAQQANILIGSTPAKFGEWTRFASAKAVQKHETCKLPAPLLFVNAWNEWAEGAVLEPTEIDGRAYLRAFLKGVS